MRITLRKRIIALLLGMLLVFQISPVYAAGSNDVSSALYGTWTGTYLGYMNGDPVERTIDIVIDYSEDGIVEGVAKIDGGKSGEYLLDGSVDYNNETILFYGAEWIKDPLGMSFSDFNGTINIQQETITGYVDADEDRPFSIKKISDNYTSTRIDLDSVPREWEGEYDGSSGYNVVRRDYEIHIKTIKENGDIEGVAIISPSLKAPMEDGANGSYYFSGKISARSGRIDIQGYEWIEYPVSHDNFTFIELYGLIDLKTGAISGSSEHGIWEMGVIEYGNIKTESGFELGIDNNNFVHTDSKTWDGAGFVGVKNYKLDDEYFERLTRYSSRGEKNRMKRAMWNRDITHWFGQWGGSCYGITMTMGLLYEGYIDISDLTNSNHLTYHSLAYPYKDNKFLNVINYYQLSQSLEIGGRSYAAKSYTINKNMFSDDVYASGEYDSLPVFLRKVVKYCSSDHVELLGYSTKHSGHAILITGCEYSQSEEKYIVKLYDENSVDSSEDNGDFSKMKIDKDFSGFTLYDADGNKEATDESFVTMYFLDWERLQPILHNQRSISYSYDTRIDFPINSEFKIVNEYGECLSYKDGKLSGDMEIKGVNTTDSDNEIRLVLTIEETDSLTATDMSENIDMNVNDQDNFVSLNASKIDKAVIDIGDSINITGTDYDFESFMSTDEISEDEDGLLSISGNAGSEINIVSVGSELKVESDDVIKDVKTGTYEGTNMVERNYSVSNESFNINEDGKIDGEEEIIVDDTNSVIDAGAVKLSQNKYVYNSKTRKPKVTVSIDNKALKQNVDYSVLYKNNKYVGTSTVIITGINDYEGVVYKNFKIVPKGTSIKKLSGKKKSITVKWKAQKKSTTGYQIQYSTKKNFKKYKTKLVKGNKKSTLKISKLSAKKKYYVRIRTYKTVKGIKYYSSWSKVKSVKTK